jgi:hypothetical protein
VATATPKPAAPAPALTPAVSASKTAPEGASAQRSGNDDLSDFSDTADWEWNLADEAEGTDFEVDADVTSYFMPVGNVVTFKVKALNGTPPFACTWDFADNSPVVKGDMVKGEMMVKHKFVEVGTPDVVVRCFDASKAESSMQLGLRITTWDDWATRMHIDAPSPGVTP